MPRGLFSKTRRHQSLAFLLSVGSILQAVPLDSSSMNLVVEEGEVTSLQPPLPSGEVVALDTNSLMQQSLTIPEIQTIPTPKLEVQPHKSPFVTMLFAALCPGLGHVYLNDLKTAGGLFGSYGAGVTAAAAFSSDPFILTNSIVTAQNLWSYNIYAAYRDVRTYNGQVGYSHKMPSDGFLDLTKAPFSWSVLKKPEVFLGLVGSLLVGATVSYFAYFDEMQVRSTLSVKKAIYPMIALPVGIGEESLFRGYLQSQFSEWFSPWGGIAASSLVFGAAHIPNAMSLPKEERWRYYSFSIPFISALGAYFGWLTQKNVSLKESVALHTWYDFVLFAIDAFANQAATTGGTSEFSIAIPF